jgi:hypothetical protein
MNKIIILASLTIALIAFLIGGVGFLVPAPVRDFIKVASEYS